jgi:hypothetical protein
VFLYFIYQSAFWGSIYWPCPFVLLTWPHHRALSRSLVLILNWAWFVSCLSHTAWLRLLTSHTVTGFRNLTSTLPTSVSTMTSPKSALANHAFLGAWLCGVLCLCVAVGKGLVGKFFFFWGKHIRIFTDRIYDSGGLCCLVIVFS